MAVAHQHAAAMDVSGAGGLEEEDEEKPAAQEGPRPSASQARASKTRGHGAPPVTTRGQAVAPPSHHSSQTGEAASKLKAVLSPEDTATPKGKTMELFGTRPDSSRKPAPDNIPTPFHVYSMRQAIQEKFILSELLSRARRTPS
ncbi:MAG TPA: hypothetical protein VGB96_02530, partial [Archangium sp.]